MFLGGCSGGEGGDMWIQLLWAVHWEAAGIRRSRDLGPAKDWIKLQTEISVPKSMLGTPPKVDFCCCLLQNQNLAEQCLDWAQHKALQCSTQSVSQTITAPHGTETLSFQALFPAPFKLPNLNPAQKTRSASRPKTGPLALWQELGRDHESDLRTEGFKVKLEI